MAPARKEPPAWVRYEARAVLAATLSLSPYAELAHHRLTVVLLANGLGAAASGTTASDVARVPAEQWASVAKELEAIGWRIRAGRWLHPEPLRLLAQARSFQRKRQAACQIASASRWGTRPPAGRPSEPLPAPPRTRQSSSAAKGTAQAEPSTLGASPRQGSPAAERRFLGLVAEHLQRFAPKAAKAELDNWGGWWRNRFREDPDKAQRVLADIGSMIKEGTVHTNPGAAAVDLWARLP